MAVIINPYKNGSRGAKRLKLALTQKGVKTFVAQRAPSNVKSLVVNWGNSEFGYDPEHYIVVNHPAVLSVMTNKLRFFKSIGHDKVVPEWTTEPREAEKWGSKVLARTILEGSGGAGIVIWDPEKEAGITIPKAPLYVKYENKTHEYRLHMARGLRDGSEFNPILIQRKIFQKGKGMETPKNWEIRNHGNGFVFVQNSGYPTPPRVIEVAKAFMEKHFKGMHFCALDVIYHEKKNRAWVLEGNTAPGLEGNTIEVYSDYFRLMAYEAKAA